MFRLNRKPDSSAPCQYDARRGAFVVLAFFCLIATIGFVSFSIDTGHLALSKTIQQNAVDSAALAAAMEITNAVENAPPEEEDPTAYAREQAKVMAVDVAALNGVYIDPDIDVTFGLRSYNPATEQFEVEWGVSPANAVKVRARRSNPDTSAPDGELPMMFARVFGDDSVRMESEAIAYIESRDISVVLDFSGSMAYDSLFRSDSVNRYGVDAIRDNLRTMYWEMAPADGDWGTLDHVDPTDSSSDRTPEVRYLTVFGEPELESDPQINVRFEYDQAYVESELAFKTVKLMYEDGDDDEDTFNVQTFSGLNATSGTYAGSGSYNGDDIVRVEVTVDVPGTGLIEQTGRLSRGDRPYVTITLNDDANEATVVLDSDDLDKIKIWYTDGSSDTFNNANGTSETVQGDPGKIIEDVKVWTDSGARKKFNDFEQPEGYEYTEVFDDDNDAVKAYFGLTNTPYPYNSGNWDSYINNIRSNGDINRGAHREMYGGITFVHYLLANKPSHWQTPELSRTSHFPFHAVRKGNELFVDFLENLGFGDHVGLVSYDQERRIESILNEDGQAIDISADPLDANYDAIKTIMDYKQANNYYPYTNIGGGIRQSIDMIDDYSRDGARPTILLMTDGNANTYDNEDGENTRDGDYTYDDFWDVPADFDWGVFSNLDTTSTVPYYVGTSGSDNKARRYALSQAFKAAEQGITVHTLAVGGGADTDLMKAIAFLGGGEYIEVSGSLTVENLLSEVQAGFYRIAALVPPARLADPEEGTP